MTAHAVKGFREECFQIGFDDFIAKPIRLQKFLKKVKKIIDKGSADREQSKQALKKSSEILIDMEDVLSRFQGDKNFFYDMINEFLIYAPSSLKISLTLNPLKEATMSWLPLTLLTSKVQRAILV